MGKDPQRGASAEQRDMIWKMQGGRCAKCQEPITKASMEVHHFYQHTCFWGWDKLREHDRPAQEM